ncbi:hypothetical protein KJ836_02915 [Patescibacteria group bacterium]|nr:hypothetical protein [Patescibacteria group bacterium]
MPTKVIEILEQQSCIVFPRYWCTKIEEISGRVILPKMVWEDLNTLIVMLQKACRGEFRLSMRRNIFSAHCPLSRDNHHGPWILMLAQIHSTKDCFWVTLQLANKLAQD